MAGMVFSVVLFLAIVLLTVGGAELVRGKCRRMLAAPPVVSGALAAPIAAAPTAAPAMATAGLTD
jgi:hypothetical protein